MKNLIRTAVAAGALALAASVPAAAAAPESDEPIILTLRRGGRTEQVTVTAAAK